MLKITGLKELQRNLNELQVVLESLDGELCNVAFNSSCPGSIDSAIQQVNRVIDERVGDLNQNSIAASIVEQLKEKYRCHILERASEARLKNSED